MTVALKERNILVQDLDCHWYSIPPSMKDEFIRLKEAIINTESYSDEWYTANDELSDTFNSYIKGD